MATIVCDMACKHRSKIKLRKWRYKDGRPCYTCGLEAVTISRVFDMDGDICAVAGEENMAHCAFYEPLEEPESEAIKSILHDCKTCAYHTVFFNGCTPDHDCTNPDGGCSNNYDRWKWCGIKKED